MAEKIQIREVGRNIVIINKLDLKRASDSDLQDHHDQCYTLETQSRYDGNYSTMIVIAEYARQISHEQKERSRLYGILRLRDMKIGEHENLFGGYDILRVPGGWLIQNVFVARDDDSVFDLKCSITAAENE